MKKITSFIIIVFAFCLLVTFSHSAYAQGEGDGGEDPDAAIPVDGGVSLLAAAGVAYGAKKIYSQKRKKDK